MKRTHPLRGWLWSSLIFLLAACCLSICSLHFATGQFYRPMFWSYLQNPWILALNTLPVVLLALLFWAAVKRTWLAFLLTAAVTMGFTWASFFKLTFRNDPVLVEDILLLKEAGNMAGKYQLFVTRGMVLVLCLIALGTLFLLFFAKQKPVGWGRVTLLAVVLLAALPLKSGLLSDVVYTQKTANNALINIWSATDIYLSKGFVYPFLHSASALTVTPPPGYDQARAQAILAGYEDGDIPEDQKVNVVGIMLEAFQDFSDFGTPKLSYDLYQGFHDLQQEGYSGRLLTNIFAGGTVNTERAFLTGCATLGSYRVPSNSYPRYFAQQGYETKGMHPCFQWFYNRQNINLNLGFQEYLYVENYFGQFTGGEVAMDNIFFPQLTEALKTSAQGEKTLFSFSVSYQGHGPYDSDRCWWGDLGQFAVADGTYTTEQQYILDNYFGSIASTVEHVTELADFMRESEEPYVLVLFGDHNPWMGDGNSVYKAMGLNLDLGTEEGFRNYYSTPYVIWANPAAEDALGREIRGKGPDLAPSFLMNELFKVCGWTGPAFLQATNQVAAQVPMIHDTGRFLEDGHITDVLTAEGQALVEDYEMLQYYYRTHFLYEVDRKE